MVTRANRAASHEIRLSGIESEAKKHHLVGNALCLDFANTLYGHGQVPLHEYLSSYPDVVVWSHRAGILNEAEAKLLLREVQSRPSEAFAAFHSAIALRETIYRLFAAVANGTPPTAKDLATLNSARSEALRHSNISRGPQGLVMDWDDKTALDRMLWPIAITAGALLTSEGARRVRQCSGDTCDWLFVDTSRNHMRRWCSMSKCGNRAKARRFHKRWRPSARQ